MILQTVTSYHIVLMFVLTQVCSINSTQFTELCNSYSYLPIAANQKLVQKIDNFCVETHAHTFSGFVAKSC